MLNSYPAMIFDFEVRNGRYGMHPKFRHFLFKVLPELQAGIAKIKTMFRHTVSHGYNSSHTKTFGEVGNVPKYLPPRRSFNISH